MKHLSAAEMILEGPTAEDSLTPLPEVGVPGPSLEGDLGATSHFPPQKHQRNCNKYF